MARKFSEEYKLEAVKLVLDTGTSARKIAKDLEIGGSTLEKWVSKYRANASTKPLSVSEREELSRVKAENQKLRLERELLKKAAVFFASERTS